MDDTFSQYPGQILRESRLGVFTQSPFLPVHFHWTTTAGGKGFQLPRMGLPAPVPANVLGEVMAAPVRVLGNQIAQPGKIRWEDVPTLTVNRFIHGADYAMDGVVSPGKSGYRKMS